MIYVTTKLPVMQHQMTFEEFLFGGDDAKGLVKNVDGTATRTIEVEKVPESIVRTTSSPWYLQELLLGFTKKYKDLYDVEDRSKLYYTFYIPKKSGGLRRIDAPNEELMGALRELGMIFKTKFGALYHTNAYAYIEKRSTLKAVERHTYNESRWYAKYDLSNFFGSTTKEFVMHMLSMIYPFSEVIKYDGGEKALSDAIDLGFLNGGLPQGTPLSPMLTNLIMIPVDYKLTKTLRDFHKQHFVYTRYADDFQISSQYDFRFKEIENLIRDTLSGFGAPFNINAKKTRYGSTSGRNYMLGLCVNRENNITVGYKKKRQFQAMVSSYAMDKKNGISWSKEDVQVLDGTFKYIRMIEHNVADNIMEHLSNKFGINIIKSILLDLSSPAAIPVCDFEF